jgi:hypothetical protein
LFTYPNEGHTSQSLQETIEHYFNDSIRREGLAEFHIVANVTADRCTVAISLDDQDIAEITSRYQEFFDNGKKGLQAADAFRASGKWDEKWMFLLPLGVPLAFAKAKEIMDFPPLTLIRKQDYLNSKTTSRWWELLVLNGVPYDERARYSCILDIVPVAAPASDGEKLRQSGIYDGPFDSYAKPLLELLVPTQAAQYRPLIALGLPIRLWIKRLWNLNLKVMDTGTIELESGAVCRVIATNHPSFFYYAVRSNKGPDATEKKLATGLLMMKQDIIGAAWHVEMGRNPGADPTAVLKMCIDKWEDRDEELLDLVKTQARFPPSILTSTEVPLAAVKPLIPGVSELEELERQFYYPGDVQHLERQALPNILDTNDVSLATIEGFMPSNQELEELERQFYASNSGHPTEGID